MNTRDIIGRRIVAVRQKRIWNRGLARPDVDLIEIELDNGVRMRPLVSDCAYDGDYAIDMVIVPPAKVEGGVK